MRCLTTRRVLRTRSANSASWRARSQSLQPERPDLAGFEPIGQQAFVIGAVAVEFGEVVVHAVQRSVLRTLTKAIGTNASSATGTSSGATLNSTSTTTSDRERCGGQKVTRPHTTSQA